MTRRVAWLVWLWCGSGVAGHARCDGVAGVAPP